MTIQIEALSPPSATQRRTPVRRGGLLAFAAVLALMLPGAQAGAQSAQSDPLIAKVNGVEVHQSDLTMAEEDMGQNAQAMTGDAKRDYLLQYISDVILAAQAAEAKKVNDQKEFKGRLAFMRNKLLMETLLQQEGKAAVTPEAMKKVYDEAAKQMSNEQEVRARHILVPTEEEAKAVLAEIKKGTDFAELAKQKSKDPGAAAEGGDLGYFTKDQMVPEFAEVAFKLEKGQVSDPVKTQFGWHIIKVEDKRTKPVPSFEQVKDQVSTYVERKAQAEYIAKLREGAKIERLDKK
ncbi:MAG: peptidylprolyl isomerase [Rhizobiales bacterium]|jgi:peptidyl-prolyl cis-trans isomerase C|nr:peptidylprolyl isomerase [Hyphomicrobiales bacterium]